MTKSSSFVLLCLVGAAVIGTAIARPRKAKTMQESSEVVCPYEGQVYNACHHTPRLCDLTCKNKDDPPSCPAMDECIPGCSCPEGKVLHKRGINKGKCVEPGECPVKTEASGKKKAGNKTAGNKKAGNKKAGNAGSGAAGGKKAGGKKAGGKKAGGSQKAGVKTKPNKKTAKQGGNKARI